MDWMLTGAGLILNRACAQDHIADVRCGFVSIRYVYIDPYACLHRSICGCSYAHTAACLHRSICLLRYILQIGNGHYLLQPITVSGLSSEAYNCEACIYEMCAREHSQVINIR